jgi:hypothetical protein
MPLQLMVQAVSPPQWMEHAVAPEHSAVQPPFGQSMLHVLSPWQVIVDPVSRVT